MVKQTYSALSAFLRFSRMLLAVVLLQLLGFTAFANKIKTVATEISFYPADHITQVTAAWQQKMIPVGLNHLLAYERNNVGYWIKISCTNLLQEDQEVNLILRARHGNTIQYFLNGDTTPIYVTGTKFAFSQRKVPDRYFIYPIKLKANERQEWLIKLQWKNGLYTKVDILSNQQLLREKQMEMFVMAIIMGAAALMFIIGIYLFIRTREKGYFFFTATVVFAVLWMMSIWGLDGWLLYPDAVYWSKISINVYFISTISALVYTFINFFQSVKQTKIFQNVLLGLIGVLIAIGIVSFINYWHPTFSEWVISIYSTAFSVVIYSILLVLLIYLVQLMRLGVGLSRYFLITFFIIIALTVLFNAYPWKNESMIENFIYNFGASFIMLLQIIFFLFGIWIRYEEYKEQSNKLALQLFKSRQASGEQVIEAQENERSRIARDLHDSLGGFLSTAKMRAPTILVNGLSDMEAAKNWVVQQFDIALREVRQISHDLMPPEIQEFGLNKSLLEVIHRWRDTNQFSIHYSYTITRELTYVEAISIYRMVRELLQNIHKHAKATDVSVQLWDEEDGSIQILVEDNGVGMNTRSANGIGWKNIRQRLAYFNGSVIIDSNNEGTTIILQIPVNQM